MLHAQSTDVKVQVANNNFLPMHAEYGRGERQWEISPCANR